ncbi:hypothetical protein FRC14_001976 [Serendipita sp. 396]|nr:hypothetical protein FRC14_001976 [Serendipita sp. 396]KAG8783982.1 hypothetical protein FRC15_004199 [Serendipita sp. 397]KAG8802041.1 hypothetical protein FRC16_010492 [Serendipita sp. 398]KAG8867838.1 hypothetical protein FRC20_004752 [Serendipita sp. 405]
MRAVARQVTLPVRRTQFSTPARFIASSSTIKAKPAPDSRPAQNLGQSQQEDDDALWDLNDVEAEDERHMSSWGWELYHQQRDFFEIMRLLQRDVPNFMKYRRPFVPPDPAQTPVLVRSVSYAGEPGHPVTPKRVIVVPLSRLPLTGEGAMHNIKVIAGSRWVLEPPKDGGLPNPRHSITYANSPQAQGAEIIDKHGYIKISCESFPEAQMNLKWCMDVLRRLVKEANERGTSPSNGSFTDIPLPTRHHDSRLRSHGKGGGSFKAEKKRITIKDFPKEWLPRSSS